MRTSIKILILLACFGLLWFLLSPTTEVRYQVAVSVRDGNRVYSNSAVWSQRITEYELLHLIGIPFSNNVFQAEAVPVEILGKGLLLMLPLGVGNQPSAASSLVFDAFNFPRSWNGLGGLIRDASALPKGATRRVDCDYGRVAEITAKAKRARAGEREAAAGQNTSGGAQDYDVPPVPRGCFVFAFMSNPRLPQTFRVLQPGASNSFGDTGLAFERLDVTITDKPITVAINRYLPWLDTLGPDEHAVTERRMPDGSFRSTIGNGMPGEIAYLRRSAF